MSAPGELLFYFYNYLHYIYIYISCGYQHARIFHLHAHPCICNLSSAYFCTIDTSWSLDYVKFDASAGPIDSGDVANVLSNAMGFESVYTVSFP